MESNVKKIKELPRVEEVLSNNLLIIEDQQGTKSLEFSNFIVGPKNVSFYNPMVTNIRSLCTYCASLCSTIERNISQSLQAVNTRFSEATGALVVQFPDFEYQYGLIGIPPGLQLAETQFNSPYANINLSDITLTPINADRQQQNPVGVVPAAITLRSETSVVDNRLVYTYFMGVTASRVMPSNYSQVYAWRLFRPII